MQARFKKRAMARRSDGERWFEARRVLNARRGFFKNRARA